MRKTLERCNKAIKRLGNEGFSLVELIIVVAIMVALVAVLAPQYFQYVEKSRKSVDTTAAKEILSATQVVALDPDIENLPTEFTVIWATDGGSGAITVEKDNAAGDVKKELVKILGTDNIVPKSNYAKTEADDFKVLVKYEDNKYTFTPTTNWIEGDAKKGS